jgi:hypothetical protein
VPDPNNPFGYVQALERAFSDDIHDFRFVAHLQLHEYETLLLAEPDSFRMPLRIARGILPP